MELDEKTIDRLACLKTGDIDDAMGQLGMSRQSSDHRLRRIVGSMPIVGTAVTGRWYIGPDDGREYNDDCAVMYGLGRSVVKAVLVQQCDIPEFVSMGSGGASVLRASGFVGCITAGWIRDTDELRQFNWPSWAYGIRPKALLVDEAPASQRIRVETDQPVEVAGAKVNPGDIIVADADGFSCIPPARLMDVISEAEKVVKIENRIFAMLDKGMSFKQILEADKRYRTVGTHSPAEFESNRQDRDEED